MEARSGAHFSADLGYSSKYSNELHDGLTWLAQVLFVGEALKIVVGKGFLRVALM